MGGSADPEAPAPSPSPAKPSPPSADGKRSRRCVQSKLSWGLAKPADGGSGGGGCGGDGEVGVAGRGDAEVVPPVPAAEEAAGKEAKEELEKRNKKRKPRKSETGRKPPSKKEKAGQDPGSKDEIIYVDESPRKKQRKGMKKDAALKVPNSNRKRCKTLESPDDIGPGECQRQLETGSPEAAPVLIDVDLMSTPSKAGHVIDNVDVMVNQDKSPLVVDLRSEAKMAAEENRRLSSGKKMHPFFASRKMNKYASQDQDVNNSEDVQGLCDFEKDPPFYPIHVVYQFEASVLVDWTNWMITDLSSLDTGTAAPRQKSVSFFEGLVKPLSIEANCKRHSNQLAEPIFAECTTSGVPFPCFSDKESEHSCSWDAIDVGQQSLLVSSASCQDFLLGLHRRPEVHQNGCQPDYYLWTDKYRPETATQVCGNSEHVKFLAEWLKVWDEKGHKIGAANIDTNDSCSYQDESDAYDSDNSSGFENVILITGPVGCGKSAAVFACAREQGFNIIEVNTSDMRNGAYVRQKFEEATKSHGLEKWSQEEVINPRDGSLDPDSGTPDRIEYQHLMPCSTRVAIDCNHQKLPTGHYSGSKASDEAPKQVINKTLILFEDVDTVFDDDRGFISTILKMAETTKWPIILTSNRKDPSLPNLLSQIVLDFKYPSTSELLSHVGMICKSEGVRVSVPQLKHVVDICLGDIRKTVMLLQFLYQGKQQSTERPNECSCVPFSLDLDAVHSTVPKMLPWEFPCKLSETVCMEIDKTILLAEEKKKMEVSDLEALQLQLTAPLIKGRSTAKTRKTRKSKLKRGHLAERNDISPCKNDLDDFHDTPTTLPSGQQTKRNRRGLLLLSESDDDPADVHTEKHEIFTVTEVGFYLQPSEAPQMHGQGISSQFPFPIESRETNEIDDSFQNPPESNMSVSISQVCDTFMSQGVSCVPESFFIVEGASASVSGDEFVSRVVPNDLSTFYDGGTCTTFRMELEDTDNVNNLMTERQKDVEDVVGETSEAYVESFGRNEQASCSTAGFQLMDECSRAESMWLLSSKKSIGSSKVEQVQDTWNRLRSCCSQVPRKANYNRSASAALKLASEVSDLISQSDLILSCCDPLTNDMLFPSSTPCAEPDNFSWYSNQVEMASVYAQHALCIFSRKSQDLDGASVDLSEELLSASTTATSLGKIICSGLGNNCRSPNISHMKNPTACISKRRERQVHLCETLFPVLPPKLWQSLRGPAFVDYLSSISQISRLENLRLSESKLINKRRRPRQSTHYLSFGALSLSPEEVALLAESGYFSGRREKIIEQAPVST